MKYIDIHCHINLDAYDVDREEVIARAQQAGVGMIIVGNDRATSEQAVALAEKNENMWAVIGLHPTNVATEAIGGEFDYEFYKKLASNPKVVGIGECGLDYFHTPQSESKAAADAVFQKKVFESHIALAEEINKPLVLHIRSSKTHDAYKDALVILRQKALSVAGDVHFFAGGLDYGRQFVALGFSLSFTGVITFAKEYHDVIKNIPLERIMSETDAPFVAPAPYRGQRNEPARVIEVAHTIAAIRGETLENVLPQLVQNARNLFKI